MDHEGIDDSMNSNTETDSVGIISGSEVMVSEKANENGVNVGNTCEISKNQPIVSNTSTSNYFEHNIISEEISEHKIINDGNLFEDNLKNVNPAPNVEDMVTDESKDGNLVVSEPKGPHEKSADITTDITEATDIDVGDCGVSVESPDQNIVIGSESEKRDHKITEAMNKDTQWKIDPGYQNNLSSLKLLCDYGSDSDEDNESMSVDKTLIADAGVVAEGNEVEIISVSKQPYRKPESDESETEDEDSDSSEEEETTEVSSSSSSSEASSSSSDESDDSLTNECIVIGEKKVKKPEVPKTKGELGLEDLPPIEDLHISVPKSQCVEIGKVLSIVDSLVVVQSIKDCPTLDLDSILFLDHGNSTLGEVFDVFGKVGQACYCVRFNSKDHALRRGVEVGMPVYYAPQTEHSKFVFLADLMKMKGSDASWTHNNEPPDRFLDYSDDEEERRAKKGDKIHKEVIVEVDESQPEVKRAHRRGNGRGRVGNWDGFEDMSPSREYRPQRPDADGVSAPWPSRGVGPLSPWGMPFNPRFPLPPPSPSSGPQPLLRPTMFANQPPLPPLGRGAPFPPSQSLWSVPPPQVRPQAGRFATPPPFMHQQQQGRPETNPTSGYGRGGFGGSPSFGPPQGAAYGGAPGNFRVPPGGFGHPKMFQQPPPPTPPGTPPPFSQNMGSVPFRNSGPQPTNFGSCRPDMHGASQNGPPPMNFGSFRPEMHNSSQSGPPPMNFGSFRPEMHNASQNGPPPMNFGSFRPEMHGVRQNGPPPMNFGSFRPEMHNASQSGPQRNAMVHRNPGQFGMQGPMFQNQNNNDDFKEEWDD